MRVTGLWARMPRGQTAAGIAVIVGTGAFVLYPVYYLLQASLDVGDPETRPPTEFGLENFAALPRYSEIMMNTLVVAFSATVMALVFGFLTAWILNRTDVPFRRTLEQAMAVPYYVTPLLGALAWSLLGAPQSGFVNQVWRALGGEGAIIDIIEPARHRLGDGAVRGLRRLRHDRRGDEVDGPVAGGGVADHRRRPAPHHAAHHAAAGHARRARGGDLRVRGDARLVFRRAGARHAQPLLRHHHGDVPACLAIPAAHSARRGDGRVAVRDHVRDAVHLSAHHRAPQLRHRQRQGVPPAPDRCRAAALGAVRRSARLRAAVGGAADPHPGLCLGAAAGGRVSRREQLHARQLPGGAVAERGALRDRQQPAARAADRDDRRRADRACCPG